MTNSIRTPKRGVTANSKRIAEAVDNEEWQKFRVAMRGLSTADKICELQAYHDLTPHTHTVTRLPGGQLTERDNCAACIRVDNYIKALCRDGQLKKGTNLLTFLDYNGMFEVSYEPIQK